MDSRSPYRYFVQLAYNGARYHGWQVQPNAPSVQETISTALGTLTGQPVNLVGCGRTDTGVHASRFFAHFELDEGKVQQELDQLAFRLNRFLPQDIAIHWIKQVPGDLHARFSAISRTYHYYIHTFKDPFLDDRSWFVHDVPAIGPMNEGAMVLLQNKDFTSFSKLHSSSKTNICHLSEAGWVQTGHHMVFTITADRFLRNMVRAIVGTLVELGQGKISMKELTEIIASKNRSDAGQSVPAHALFLEGIEYPMEYAHIFNGSGEGL